MSTTALLPLLLTFLVAGTGGEPPEALLILNPAGEPLAGAMVEIWPPLDTADPLAAMAPPWVKGVTDRDGRLVASPPARGGFLLIVDHPNFEPWARELEPAFWREGLRLSPGRSFRGHLEPAVAAAELGRICSRFEEHLAPWQLTRGFERCTTIGTDGTFELSGLPAAATRAVVEVPGYLSAEVATGDAAQPAAIELAEGFPLTGRTLLGKTDKPLGGVRVTAPGSAPVVSDGLGRFRLAVAERPAEVSASAPGYHSLAQTAGGEGASGELLLRLEPRETVSFSATDPEARPVSDVAVKVEQILPNGMRRTALEEAKAESDGRIPFDLPAVGTYHLTVSAAGLRGTALPVFAIEEGQHLELGAVALARGARITGRVIDAASNLPVAGAELALLPLGLRAVRAAQDQQAPRTFSDRHGQFQLAGLPAGRAVLAVSHPDFAARRLGVLLRRDQEHSEDGLWLDRGVAISGRVLRAGGSGLVVRFFEADLPLLSPAAEATTDAGGHFRLSRLAAGLYRVEVRGERPLLVQEVEVPVGVGELPLELLPALTSIRGRVVRDGVAAAGGSLRFTPVLDPGRQLGKTQIQFQGRRSAAFTHGAPIPAYAARVGEDGSFVLSGITPGAYELVHQSADGTLVRRRCEIPEPGLDEVEIDLGGRSLGGRITDRSSGAGLGAAVEVRDLEGLLLTTVQADADGAFTAVDLPAGPLIVRVRAAGFRTVLARRDELSNAPLEIALEPAAAGSLELRAATGEGEPVSFATVTLVASGGSMERSLPTSAHGLRRFEGLAAGEYFAVLTDPEVGLLVVGRFDLGAGQERAAEVEAPPGAFVTLECDPEFCRGAGVERLDLETRDGLELCPYLPAALPALRFSAQGRLGLGVLGRGEYAVSLTVHGRALAARFAVTGPEPQAVALRH